MIHILRSKNWSQFSQFLQVNNLTSDQSSQNARAVQMSWKLIDPKKRLSPNHLQRPD